jgi:hypothetical protein
MSSLGAGERFHGMGSGVMGAGAETDIGSGVEVRAAPAPACQVTTKEGVGHRLGD